MKPPHINIWLWVQRHTQTPLLCERLKWNQSNRHIYEVRMLFDLRFKSNICLTPTLIPSRLLHLLGFLSSNTVCNKGPVAKMFHFDIYELKWKEELCPQILLNCSVSSACDVLFLGTLIIFTFQLEWFHLGVLRLLLLRKCDNSDIRSLDLNWGVERKEN